MKTVNLTLALAALTLTACNPGKSTTEAAPNLSAITGSWTDESQDMSSRLAMIVKADSVTFEKTCVTEGGSVTVRATAPAIVSSTHINVLQTKSEIKPAGDVMCEAKVDQGLIAYEVNKEGKLLLTPKGKTQFVFGAKTVVKSETSEPKAEAKGFIRKWVDSMGETQPE